METKEIKVYEFSELAEDVQEKVLENHRWWNVEDIEWWDSVYELAKTVGKLIGIEIDDIWFAGFGFQGAGACFEGYYSYERGSVKKVKKYAPNNTELHKIAEGLQDVQRHAFYKLSAVTKHHGRYFDMDITTYKDGIEYDTSEEEHDGLVEFLNDFAHWIYKYLEAEYDYLISDDAVRESLEANEMRFLENGKDFDY